MVRIKVDVTRNDILDGRRFDPCKCPVALALKRQRKTVVVTETEITFGRRRFDTPLEMREFIQDFDTGESVRPQTFWLSGE